MLTPALEKLVLKGKASYNTYVIGQSEKYILDVQSDRFIIITGLTYFSRLNSAQTNLTTAQLNELFYESLTQLRVFSNKSNNLFLFRDNFTVNPTGLGDNLHHVSPMGHVQLNTYLIHDSSVSFTFAKSAKRSTVSAIMNNTVPGTKPPFDYGKQGIVEALTVVVKTTDIVSGLESYPAGLVDILPNSTNPTTTEFTIPVDRDHYPYVVDPFNWPIVLVEYVEILGNPNNIAATL
jgi:hypothetical protein